MSIRIKFFGVLLFLLLSTLAIFSWFVYRTIYEDKKLFVMDLNLTLLHAVTSDVKLELKGRLDELQIFLPRVFQADPKDAFKGLSKELPDEILGATFYKKTDKGFEAIKEYHNVNLLARRHLPGEIFAGINQSRPLPLDTFGAESMALLNRSTKVDANGTKVELSLLTFLLAGTSLNEAGNGIFIAVDFLQDFLRQRLQKSELADVFLIFANGTLLSHPTQSATLEFAAAPFQHPVLSRLKGRQFPRESLEMNVDGEPTFVNIAETGFKDLYAVAETKRSDAMMAMRTMAEKGVLIAILILALSLIVSTLFASRMTSGIRKLREAAELIGTGQFNIRVDVRSNDEIGAVARKFQWMAGRLRELMDQSVEAARNREEGETSRVIQSTLQVVPRLETPIVEASHFFQGAAESGSNFWDAHADENFLTILIGDATSKGVPAALTTAMARSCFTTLCTSPAGEALRPEPMLTHLNRLFHTICHGKLTLSACIAQLNLETGELRIATAGNLSPIVVTKKGDAAQARRLAGKGPVIGAKADTVYKAAQHELQLHDMLVFDTPGFTDALNADGKMWGETEVLLTLSGARTTSAAALKARLEAAYKEFTGKAEGPEDATAVVVHWKQKPSALRPKAPAPAASLWTTKTTEVSRPPKAKEAPLASSVTDLTDEPYETYLESPSGALKAPHVHDIPNFEEESARRDAYIYEDKEIPEVAAADDDDQKKPGGSSGSAAA